MPSNNSLLHDLRWHDKRKPDSGVTSHVLLLLVCCRDCCKLEKRAYGMTLQVHAAVQGRNMTEDSPMAPSASFIAQKRRKAMAFRETSMLWGLLVKAMRQLTQSVKVVISVSVMKSKCSRTIFSMVSKARRTMVGCSSPAAVVNTMNIDFQPDLTLPTRANTIWDTHLAEAERTC